MCGIVGKLDFGSHVDRTLIERMCSAIEHRGPDSRRVWCDGPVGLGMQRLAIIDWASHRLFRTRQTGRFAAQLGQRCFTKRGGAAGGL